MYSRLLISTLLFAGGSLQAETVDSPPPAAVSDPVTSPEPDCEALFLNAQAVADRGLQQANLKRWADAVPVLREASKNLMHVVGNCPAEEKAASLLEERISRAGKQAEVTLNHQTQCLPRLDNALEFDIRASAARRESRDPKALESLFADAENAWRGAFESCQSPYREKAERNLKATVKARADNAELFSSGPACDNASKNANSMVELAKDAWKGKRWDEAAMFYNKAQLAWERAAENCTGSRQQIAEKKIEQSRVDAHNAEFCGPQWDEANELVQQMKARAATAALSEREVLSIKTEVAWRDAVTLCQGGPQSLAKNNAEAIARERGAPLPPTAMDTYGKKPVLAKNDEPVFMPAGIPDESPAIVSSARKVAVPAPIPVPVPAKVDTPPTNAAPLADKVTIPAPSPAKPVVQEMIVAEGTTYRGKFSADPVSGKISGEGTVEWPNGDRFNGTIVDGQRHGKGRFTWKGGQWYDGDWQRDLATGRGVIFFTDGNRYEGSVSNGGPQGQGSMNFASGDRYTGQFRQGLFHGQGSYFWTSGSSYVGDWVLGKKHGIGRLTMAGGGGLEGEFIDDEETEKVRRFKLTDNSAAR